jgi:hypothetical protein
MAFLSEVKFDTDIIQRHEFTSLAKSREDILKRWHNGSNKAETFEDSLARVRKIESFLNEWRGKTIILVMHGWFLRLLDIYFIKGKHMNITLDDILETKPVPLGHCIKANVARKNRFESLMELVGDDILISSLVTPTGNLTMQTTCERAHSLTPVIS